MSQEYRPSDVRFKIARDPISRERKDALVAIMRDIRERHPGVRMACSVFGSLSKGKDLTDFGDARQSSRSPADNDVDMVIFFDGDDALRVSGNEHESAWFAYDFGNGIRRSIEALWLSRSMRTPQPLPPLHMHVYPISETGTHSILQTIQRLSQQWPLTVRRESGYFDHYEAETVARFFHLDFGGGLKPYRRQLLRQLAGMDPNERDRLWGIVDVCVRNFERKGVIPVNAEHQFPSTYAEAVRYYGISDEIRETRQSIYEEDI